MTSTVGGEDIYRRPLEQLENNKIGLWEWYYWINSALSINTGPQLPAINYSWSVYCCRGDSMQLHFHPILQRWFTEGNNYYVYDLVSISEGISNLSGIEKVKTPFCRSQKIEIPICFFFLCKWSLVGVVNIYSLLTVRKFVIVSGRLSPGRHYPFPYYSWWP